MAKQLQLDPRAAMVVSNRSPASLASLAISDLTPRNQWACPRNQRPYRAGARWAGWRKPNQLAQPVGAAGYMGISHAISGHCRYLRISTELVIGGVWIFANIHSVVVGAKL